MENLRQKHCLLPHLLYQDSSLSGSIHRFGSFSLDQNPFAFTAFRNLNGG